ncbi:MAG: GTPase HflX [Bilifractor sp.]
MYENAEKKERVILVAVNTDDETKVRDSLQELEALAQTDGVEVVTSVLQNRENPDPGTYIGKGKIEEIASMLDMLEADAIITDDELSPAQMNNLAEALHCRVYDRTMVILDIFAKRAQTSEGKIQVELAQLRYRQQHLVGMRTYLSRLGGGIGTRGPGEKKLEIDRRLIADRISALNQDLKKVAEHREVLRQGRQKGNMKVAAIVGYTNAGKSTLLNTLTHAGVLEEDALFATLDPTTRLLNLPEGGQVLLTDTVGFIHKLPHTLIDAFRSTLEEVTLADYIVHVVDASNPHLEQQMDVVYQTLHELKADQKKIITLFNKQDRVVQKVHMHDHHADYVIPVSAKYGEGLDAFMRILEKIIRDEQIYLERIFPYQDAGKIAMVRQAGTLMEEAYLPEGIRIRAYVPKEIYGKL